MASAFWHERGIEKWCSGRRETAAPLHPFDVTGETYMILPCRQKGVGERFVLSVFACASVPSYPLAFEPVA